MGNPGHELVSVLDADFANSSFNGYTKMPMPNINFGKVGNYNYLSLKYIGSLSVNR